MILIVGGSSDPNTLRLVDRSRDLQIASVFWDTDRPNSHRIAWDFGSPVIDLGNESIEPSAVFLRFNVFNGDAERNLSVFEMIQSYALAWPQHRFLNREVCTDSNNKVKNLRIAREVGFEIPDTILLADLTPLATIPDPDARIIKPLGGGAHTVCVSQICGDMKRLASLGPHFIQEKLRGENLRVFSVGSNLFCFHLITSHLDYRDDQRVDVVQIEVPEEIISSTKNLVRRLGFDFCALDFRCRDGFKSPVFLEINSFPMFVRFDDAAQCSITDAILAFLIAQPDPGGLVDLVVGAGFRVGS